MDKCALFFDEHTVYFMAAGIILAVLLFFYRRWKKRK